MLTPLCYQKLVNDYLAAMPYDRKPALLYEPVQYELSLGGKRIRSVLMLMAYHLLKENVEDILPVAIGLETYHNYTLVHDDIMDHAEVRRGKPTVHVKWNQNQALLASEVMVLAAYQGVMQALPSCRQQVLELFTETALQISEGQQYDIDFETREDVTVEEYIEMIRLKTSVLLACALQMGAIMGGASEKDAQLIYEFGVKYGLAFQLQDDLLDVYGDPATFGKKIGGDILCNKKTYMLISAQKLAQGEDAEELKKWLADENPVPREKIAAVTAIYDRLGIQALCVRRIEELYAQAKEAWLAMSFDVEKKQVLWDYVESMLYRTF